MKLAQRSGILTTYALGSCVGICLYDPVLQLGGMVHIMLPQNMEKGRANPLKYADTGIHYAIGQMESRGAQRSRITAKIAGGAKMFSEGNSAAGNIGQRNIQAVKLALQWHRIPIIAEDVGGASARTLIFDVSAGIATVRSYGKSDHNL